MHFAFRPLVSGETSRSTQELPATREGYPEIAEYWKTAAFEEAEHAAKFAELLGEVVSPSTAENLRVRVEAENGATAGKFELAKKG